MTFTALIFLAIGLSMDAFAVSVCLGLSAKKAIVKKSIIAGLYFGIFQAVMPLLGFLLATRFAELIIDFDHWVAFILLSFLGGKMIYGSFKKEECCDEKETQLTPRHMLPLAIATSIDALAVGITFAFLQVRILPAIMLIGTMTCLLSMTGVYIGSVFGIKFKSKAEITGGVILILIGLKILAEHL